MITMEFRLPSVLSIKECEAAPAHSFEIPPDGESITFKPCGVRSFHPKDVENRYCGRCHRFIKEQENDQHEE
jgi:hypothetical protein